MNVLYEWKVLDIKSEEGSGVFDKLEDFGSKLDEIDHSNVLLMLSKRYFEDNGDFLDNAEAFVTERGLEKVFDDGRIAITGEYHHHVNQHRKQRRSLGVLTSRSWQLDTRIKLWQNFKLEQWPIAWPQESHPMFYFG